MASRSARRRRRQAAAATQPTVQSVQSGPPEIVDEVHVHDTRLLAAAMAEASPELVLPLAVAWRDPDDPPIFARLLGEFGGLPDPPGTVWGQPADLSRRGLAAAFLQLWPDARTALVAAVDEPTLADDPQPDIYEWPADVDATAVLPGLEVAHA